MKAKRSSEPPGELANPEGRVETHQRDGTLQPANTDPVTDPAPDVDAFWRRAVNRAGLRTLPGYFGPGALESVTPAAWSFGADARQADDLADLVLAGMKTATAGALWDYETEGEELPRPLDLSIVLDGTGQPVALLRVTTVEVRPFDEVDEEHAWLEGEGDGSLAYWREVHEQFFREVATHDHGFRPDMPVVMERFEVLYSEPRLPGPRVEIP